MQKTRFERYLDESIRKMKRLTGKAMTPLEVKDAFFPNKVAVMQNGFTPKEGCKNAIILVGPSCCGKTKFAFEFVKEHTDFVLTSIDKCAADDMREMDEIDLLSMALGADGRNPDDLGNRRFGRMLEAGHKNIIVDGNWMHVNSRGALLKTLSDLNYHTCIYLTLPSEDSYRQKIKNRVIEIIASRRLNVDPSCILDGVDLIELYAATAGISVAEARDSIEGTEEYQELLKTEYELLDQEAIEANFEPQIPSYIVYLGADELTLVDSL